MLNRSLQAVDSSHMICAAADGLLHIPWELAIDSGKFTLLFSLFYYLLCAVTLVSLEYSLKGGLSSGNSSNSL